MAQERLTDKDEQSAPHNDDWLHTVDESDTTSHDDGTSKKIKLSTLYTWIKGQIDTAYGAFVTRWPAWGEVTGKPTEFTPEAHSHAPNTLPNGHADDEEDISGTHEINFDSQYNAAKITVNGNTDLEYVNAPDGMILITLEQDATGRTITLVGNWEHEASEGTIDATPNSTTKLFCFYDSIFDQMHIIRNYKL